MFDKIKNILREAKSNPLKRSMLLSTLCKPIGMLISFLYTPLLLSYLGDEAYGLWSTILSVINWINYFDVGIGQGLRNTLSKQINSGDEEGANKATSTGYIVLSSISGISFILGTAFILIADLGLLFNTTINLRSALLVSFFCICINFVLGLSRSMLFATQQAEKVSFMTVLVQLINLVGIFVLSQFSQGSLIAVAIVIGLSGIVVNLLFSGGLWRKYKFLIPKFKNYDKNQLKDVCSIGIKFFFIQIAAMILYTTDNMIITVLFGPEFVTPYHTSYTAFGIVNGLFAAFSSPLWSRYTVAKQNGDYVFIKKTINSLLKMMPFIVLVLLIGVFAFEPVSKIWLHKELDYDPGLNACMAVYNVLVIWGSIYATVMNGMGKVNQQLVLGVSTAILNIPLSVFFAKYCGMRTTGVLMGTIVCMLIANIPNTISITRYLNRKIKEQQST